MKLLAEIQLNEEGVGIGEDYWDKRKARAEELTEKLCMSFSEMIMRFLEGDE